MTANKATRELQRETEIKLGRISLLENRRRRLELEESQAHASPLLPQPPPLLPPQLPPPQQLLLPLLPLQHPQLQLQHQQQQVGEPAGAPPGSMEAGISSQAGWQQEQAA